MMYRILLLSLFTLIRGFLSAQPVTIQTEPARVEYYRMPDQPLDRRFTTFESHVEATFSQLGKVNMSESSIIRDYLQLEGYRSVSSNGDIEITASIGDFTIWNEARTTSRTKVKDKDGKEQVRIRYQIEVRYSMPLALQVYDRSGTRLLDKYILTNSNTKTWTSTSYDDLSDLESYWRIQRSSKLTELHRNLLEEGLKSIRNEVNLNFGFRKISDKIRFETIGKKKHEAYDTYLKHIGVLQDAFSVMSADGSLEPIKSKIKTTLAFFQAESAKFKSNSKDDQRLRHICICNQALAYLWTEEFEKAEALGQILIKADGKDKDAKRLMEDLAYTRSSLQLAGRTSRHKVVVDGKA